VTSPVRLCNHGRPWQLKSVEKVAAQDRARLEEAERQTRLEKDLENRRRIQEVLKELREEEEQEVLFTINR
jgi:hypothetical protein